MFFIFFFYIKETWIQSAYLQVCALLTNPICNYAISCWTYCCYFFLGCGYAWSLQPKPRENQKHFSVNVWSEVHVCLFVLPEFFVFLRCQQLTWWKNNSRTQGVLGFSIARQKETKAKNIQTQKNLIVAKGGSSGGSRHIYEHMQKLG